MNRIPKCRAKYFIPQQNNIKIATKESFNEHIVPKITQRNLKFNGNRNFGKDITNSIKNKVITVGDKKSNYDLQIKKHSSATQVIQKEQKLKISINEKKLRENKSGDYISKKNEININKDKTKPGNNKKENIYHIGGSKLHNSISFGVNNICKPTNGKVVSARVPSQKINKNRNTYNIKININKNDIKSHDINLM